MKRLGIVVLALILLSACERQVRTAQQAPPPPPAPAPAPHPITTLGEHEKETLLRDSTALIRQLTLDPASALPDGVLNATRCFVLVLPNRARGLSSCRAVATPYSWSAIDFVSLKGPQPPDTALLILILSKHAAETVANGPLDLARVKTAAGKTQKQTSVLTQADLAYDAVSYRYTDGVFDGTSVAVTISPSTPGLMLETPGGGADRGPHATRLHDEYVNWVKSYFNTITPTGIIIHHSAAIPGVGKVPTRVEDIDEYHAQRGMDIECFGREYHVAYHYLIFPNGAITAGRPERCEGAHARGYNSYIGVSLVGDFSSADNPRGSKGPAEPSSKQLKSLIRLTRQLQQKYNIPVQRILRHSDVASTACPGDRFAFKTFLLALERPQPGSP